MGVMGVLDVAREANAGAATDVSIAGVAAAIEVGATTLVIGREGAAGGEDATADAVRRGALVSRRAGDVDLSCGTPSGPGENKSGRLKAGVAITGLAASMADVALAAFTLFAAVAVLIGVAAFVAFVLLAALGAEVTWLCAFFAFFFFAVMIVFLVAGYPSHVAAAKFVRPCAPVCDNRAAQLVAAAISVTFARTVRLTRALDDARMRA